MYLVNHGTYWSVEEMRKLKSMSDTGLTMHQIADRLRRTPTACNDRLRMIKISIMFTQGRPEDTLKTYFAKKEIA